MIKIALAQFDFPVGDMVGNLARARKCIADAIAGGADLILFPEMAISGYPAEDLLLRPGFMKHCHAVLEELVQDVRGIDVVIGHPWQEGLDGADGADGTARGDRGIGGEGANLENGGEAGACYNAVSWIRDGEVLGRYFKHRLPNYAVFDERRYFTAGTEPLVVEVKGCRMGVLVCEDSWRDHAVMLAKEAGAQLLLLANASPYRDDKLASRRQMLKDRLDVCGLPMVYCNLVGGQDELVFDGRSMLISAAGQVSVFSPVCEEKLLFAEFDGGGSGLGSTSSAGLGSDAGPGAGLGTGLGTSSGSGDLRYVSAETFFDQNLITDGGGEGRVGEGRVGEGRVGEGRVGEGRTGEGAAGENVTASVYSVLVRGLRDYVLKNGFSDVVLGLSGGIDSALTLALAVDALGSEHVHAVMMPSRHTSQLSLDLASEQAAMLSVNYEIISIEPAFAALTETLAPAFEGHQPDITEENLQARIRGNILMAMSNKFGWMVLATGNKSELAVGYSTIYGDMCGGFSPIKDCLKMRVNALCEYRNTRTPAVPQAVIDRPPSAELAPDQLDQDSLPAYEILDQILIHYVEQDWSISEIVAAGFEEEVVRRVAAMVIRNEYKRRQGAPGVRVTSKAFGRDRRYPITSGWHEEPAG